VLTTHQDYAPKIWICNQRESREGIVPHRISIPLPRGAVETVLRQGTGV
jgi:hypothetical protein